ncbi:Ribokinase [Shimia sp. SK013]|uniref:ribokinase n=1 Tax=Shimia sp. SK013 TaxID=1389006 RepID=UPI0006B41235|nr:ribokinase [Shimia sp. SK013]KPA19824.1 Ribokinase [Shimia sp. SK013]
MAIYNLGSINADYFYRVPHLPGPGETLAADGLTRGLGGKGANMSVAAARAGAHTIHIGAVGMDGLWARDQMMESGVDTRHVATLDNTPTGHAIINVDDAGENAIVLLPGANHKIPSKTRAAALSEASPGDTLLVQNETLNQADTAKTARELGLYVAYAAAPFDATATAAILPFLDFLILNEIEAAQLTAATAKTPDALGVADVIVTLGAKGARWLSGDTIRDFPAMPVTPVDTTGAGDTFTGFVLAARDRGLPMEQAIALATRAAALMVTRHGTADVIPDLKEVDEARF